MRFRKRQHDDLRSMYCIFQCASKHHVYDTKDEKIAGDFKIAISLFPEDKTCLIEKLLDEENILELVLTHGGCSTKCVRCEYLPNDVIKEILETKKNIPNRIKLEWLCAFGLQEEAYEFSQRNLNQFESITLNTLDHILCNGWDKIYIGTFGGHPEISLSYFLMKCQSIKIAEFYIGLKYFHASEQKMSQGLECIYEYFNGCGFKNIDLILVLLRYFPILDDHIVLEDGDYDVVRKMKEYRISRYGIYSMSDEMKREIYHSNEYLCERMLIDDWRYVKYYPYKFKSIDTYVSCIKSILRLPR